MIQQRIAVFGHRSGEDNNFVELSDPLEEGIDTGPLDDVDIVVLALNLNRYGKVRLMEDL